MLVRKNVSGEELMKEYLVIPKQQQLKNGPSKLHYQDLLVYFYVDLVHILFFL